MTILRANWKLIGLAALLAFAILQTIRLSASQSAHRAEQAQRKADAASYARAQAEASQKALQAKIAKEKEYADNAEAAQAGYDALRQRYDGLLRAASAQSAGSRSVAPAQGSDPDLPEKPAAVPVYVLPEADWLKLPGLQAYADQCFNWALSLDKVE